MLFRSLLWTLHPLNTEVVDYLMQRTESMMAAFYLLTIYASLRASTPPGIAASLSPGAASTSLSPGRWLILGVLSCAAGMASKESMVTAPLVVWIFDRIFLFPSWRDSLRARWAFYLGLAATWGVLAALMLSSPRTFSAGFVGIQVSSVQYFLNQLKMVSWYLWLSVWPKDLVLFYGWTPQVTVAQIWPYALFLGLLLAATIAMLVRRPKVGFLGLWVAMTLAPSSSIAPIAAEVGAERRMYLPLIGVCVLVAVFVGRAFRPGARGGPEGPPYVQTAGLVLLLLVAAALGTRTFYRNQEYASSLVMAETVMARWPTPIAHDMLGTALAGEGRHLEAVGHLRESAKDYPAARYSLGAELLNMGKLDEAAPILEAYARDEPRDARGRAGRVGLGRAYEASGQYSRAAVEYQAMLDARPDDVEAHGLLAGALAAAGQFAQAVPHYQTYLATAARDAGGWTGLGIALIGSDRLPEAIEAFRQAVAIDPNDAGFQRNLAKAIEAQRPIKDNVKK